MDIATFTIPRNDDSLGQHSPHSTFNHFLCFCNGTAAESNDDGLGRAYICRLFGPAASQTAIQTYLQIDRRNESRKRNKKWKT